MIIKNDADIAADNVLGYVRNDTAVGFEVVGLRSVGSFPLAVSGSTFTSSSPLPPGAEARVAVDYAYTDEYEQKQTSGYFAFSLKADAPFRNTGDYIEVFHEQEVADPPLVDNYRPYISNDPYPRRPGSVLKGSARSTQSVPEPDHLEFTWLRDLQPIPGAHGISYTATEDDVGHQIYFAVAYSKAGYTTSHSHSEGVPIGPGPGW
ncbi:hypothetical protein [Herbiconiux sp.]|uniref:hypothetical protein n=1 Tax=Herbiconiux sp. TaxID=1871186 RepID=UPI0025B9734B|nr:hypothetical protein [Herbiconiux sp.]